MGNADINIEATDGVARLTLTRPGKRNAVTGPMWQAMVDELGPLAEDRSVRILVVSGSGGSFCAGADLESVRDESGAESGEFRALAEAGLAAVRDFPRPSVAVIDGPCIGAGALLALSCDVRLATPGSTFAVPAVRYGLEVEPYGLARLVELVGFGQASRFLLAGLKLDGREALDIGLIEVCDQDASELAQRLIEAIASADPAAVDGTLRSIRGLVVRT